MFENNNVWDGEYADSFKDMFYEYGNSVNIMKRGLTIGGYESALLVELSL